MKKLTLALVTLLSLGLMATAAWAYDGWGCGGWGAPRTNNQALSDQDQAKLEKFQADTQGLRRDLVTKRTELRALMESEKPDAKRAGELAGQIYDLKEQLRDKAEAAGLPALGPGGGPGYGFCGGPGYGHRGYDNDDYGRGHGWGGRHMMGGRGMYD